MGGAIIDHEDGGVRRCNTCLTEIFRGVCQGCGEMYEFYDDDSGGSDMDLGVGPMSYLDYLGHLNADDDDDDDEDRDEPYESDFVVNDDVVELEGDGEGFDEDHEEHPFFHPVVQEIIDITDDSDDGSDNDPMILPPARLRRRDLDPIIDDDNDDDVSTSIRHSII